MGDKPFKHAQCLRCFYSLKGLANNVCPECGEPFDPEDSSTFHTHLPMGRLTRMLLHPMGVVAYLATGIAFLSSLWVARVPGLEESLLQLICVMFWALLLIWWGLHVCAILVYARRAAVRILTEIRRRLVSVTAVPALFILAFLIANTGLPMHMAFMFSEKPLEALSQQAMQSPAWTSQSLDRWVGLYYVEGWTRTEEGVRLHIPASGGIVFSYDFVYSPNTAPVSRAGDYYSHYRKAWYIRRYYGG